MLAVAGAGMAGLCAAARARELGLNPVVFEKGVRPGGSMLISSCVVWRYRTLDDFRRECPGGDATLQARVLARLDDDLDWLESLGAQAVSRETGNPRTTGRRFDPVELTKALVRAAGDVRRATPFPADRRPLVLATGGFGGSRELVARYIRPTDALMVRANPWSVGDGLAHALARGAGLTAGMGEFYGRNMPAARVPEERYVSAAQLYGRHATVVNEDGHRFAPDPPSWSETDLVQATARQPRARAWYVVDRRALGKRVRERTVEDMIAAAEAVEAEVRRADDPRELGLDLEPHPKLAEPPFTAVHVHAAITHTIGGLRIDEHARVLAEDGRPIEHLYAAGADTGGIATGGYASGLAAALVFGKLAAETAAADLT